MSRALKVAIYQPDQEVESLRTALLAIDGLRIVGQWDGTCDLASLVPQTKPDVVAVVLNGPSARKVLETVGSVTKSHPELPFVGVGLPNDPELLKQAVRARMGELLDLPIDTDKLLSILQGVAEQQAAKASGRLVAVRGTGGGCGGTTVAVNLAAELAQRDAGKVVVVDLDLKFGQVATMFDLSPAFTLAELAQESDEYDDRLLNTALAKHESGVLVLARPRDPDTANVSLVKISAILNALIENYSWVVVDETVRHEMTARVVQDLADDLLLVVHSVVTNVRNATQIISNLSSGFNLDRLRLVVNRVPKRPGAVTVEKIAETLKRPVYGQIPDDWDTVSQAINLGAPLCRHAPDSKVRAAYRDLAAKLVGAAAPAATQQLQASGMGWFKGLLRRG